MLLSFYYLLRPYCYTNQFTLFVLHSLYACAFAVFGVDKHHVRDMNWSLFLYDTALRVLCIRFSGFRYHIDLFHQNTLLVGIDLQYSTRFVAFIVACDYYYVIAFFNM